MGNITMQAKDTLSAKLANCYMTIGERRYNAFNLISFEAKFKKLKQQVPILGKPGKGNKSTGWEGTFEAKLHYNSSVFRKMMEDFKNTGKDVYFEIVVTNDDPGSDAGRQTAVFTGCNLDEGILAKFDADSDDPLDEDVSGTFEDFKYPETFKDLNGFLA